MTVGSPPRAASSSDARPRSEFASAWRRRRLTVDDRIARGRAARRDAPRSIHGRGSRPRPSRPGGAAGAAGATRVPELVPIRYGRMLVSPFTFFRGAALVMAADLAGTPRSGVTVQLCGDAHLSNFGAVRHARSGGCCSTSTTSTRRCPGRGSGTSSGSRPASRSWAATAGSPPRTGATSCMAGRARVPGPDAAGGRDGRAGGLVRRTSRPATLLTIVRKEVAGKRLGKQEVRRPTRTWSPRPVPGTARACSPSAPARVDGELRIVADPPLIVPVEDLFARAREWDDPDARASRSCSAPTGGR